MRQLQRSASRFRPVAVSALLVGLLFHGCGGTGPEAFDPGTLRIVVDKVSFAGLGGMTLDIVRLEVKHTPDLIQEAQTMVLSDTPTRLSLVGFGGITPELLNEYPGIPPGFIVQIRLILGDQSVATVDFDEVPVKVPSGQQTGEKAIAAGTEVEIVDQQVTSVTLRLDPDKSVINNLGQDFIVKPVIKIILGEVSSVPFDEVVPGQAYMGFKPGVSEEDRQALFDELAAVVVNRNPTRPNYLLEFSDLTVEDALAVLRSNEKEDVVRFSTKNFVLRVSQVFPDDPLFPGQWHFHNDGTNGTVADADMDGPEAWAITQGNAGIIVAVIDTGADLTHPDLAANLFVNVGEIANNSIDDDGNGYIDDVYGYNALTQRGNAVNVEDDLGHGTGTASCVGAIGNNLTDVAGTAWNVTIVPIKINFAGTSSVDMARYDIALSYAVDIGAVITNQSFGGIYTQDSASQTQLEAMYDSALSGSVLNVIAAGNNSFDFDADTGLYFFPAEINRPNTLVVAATNSSDAKTGFSNGGAVSVDIGAPGIFIQMLDDAGGTQVNMGTSFSAPLTAGVAALVLDAGTAFAGDPVGIKNQIVSTGDLVNVAHTVSGRRLNAANAVQ